jgi:hypothetical protein
VTGFEDARNAIESRMAANWSTTPIRYENVPFKETADPYVALFIRDGEGIQASLGQVALRRWPGLIVVQVFVLPDTGTKLAKTYAETIGAIFDRAEFAVPNGGSITCRIPSIAEVGVTNGWYQVNVTIPFIRDRQY